MTARTRPVLAAVAGALIGAIVTISVQGSATSDAGDGGRVDERRNVEATRTFLAWVPGGLPDGFEAAARALPETGLVAAVAEDHAWLVRSEGADGEVVDRSRRPYAIPIDTIAVEGRTFAPFLGPSHRARGGSIPAGGGVLSATGARLRGVGVGGELRFATGARVRVAAVLPDDALGGAELLVARDTGRSIGVHTDRYVLTRASAGTLLRADTLRTLLEPLLPDDLGALGRVQVRTAAQTPLLRPGDAVLSTAQMKLAFGEFAARVEPRRPGYLDLDPAWLDRHAVTRRVPILGVVTCHEAIVPQLLGALRELRRRGLAGTIDTYDGCLVPRFIGRDPSGLISHHTWGVAIDVNIADNYYGARPHQDPRLVRVMERWGFQWGGRFIVPDGNHFEYRRAPAVART